MASNIKKNYSASIKGIVGIDDNKIVVEVEDSAEPIVLADFIDDFLDKPNVKITISYGEEL